MVRITTFVSAVALLSTLASGAPSLKRRQDDSAIGDQVGVSAPDGIPITDAGELASQRAREAGQTVAAPVATMAGSYGAAQWGQHGQAAPKVEHAPPPVHQKAPVQHAPPPAHTPVEQKAPVAVMHTPTVQHTPTAAAPVHTPPAPVHTSSSVAHTSSTVAPVATHAPPPAAPLPSHGSGSAPWNNEYNDCVQQCINTHGAPVAKQPTPAASAGSTGTGATHTVIVAPTQGVLRYIPFAVNATIGDTIKFMWGANNHTVTKSSALLPCNRSGDATSVFASGVQNKDFVFTQVVNETNPTYFFCATPGHCQKGMFGVVNPSTNFSSFSSVSGNMQTIAAANPNVKAYAAYTAKQTEGNALAARWGSNLDVMAFPDWARATVAENVLFTRNFLAANPETLKEDGRIDLSSAGTVPLVMPMDVAAALASAPAETTPVAAPPAETAANTDAAGTSANLNNSALSGSSPRILVALMAILATFALL